MRYAVEMNRLIELQMDNSIGNRAAGEPHLLGRAPRLVPANDRAADLRETF